MSTSIVENTETPMLLSFTYEEGPVAQEKPLDEVQIQVNDDQAWQKWTDKTTHGHSDNPVAVHKAETSFWRSWWNKLVTPSESQEGRDSSRRDSSSSSDDDQDVLVIGAEYGDLPIQYVVKDLRSNELPVIGTYVSKGIAQGFPYRVRRLGTDTFLFGGEAKTLMRMGMGYGKRLTFEGESLNENNNYFWSDSLPEGYGFTLVPVKEDTVMTICNTEGQELGKASILKVDNSKQEEVGSRVRKGCVTKTVSVSFVCNVNCPTSSNGLVPLSVGQKYCLTGVAELVKPKGAYRAQLECIHNITLPGFGDCLFYRE